jgi:hypothetical protein
VGDCQCSYITKLRAKKNHTIGIILVCVLWVFFCGKFSPFFIKKKGGGNMLSQFPSFLGKKNHQKMKENKSPKNSQKSSQLLAM